MQIFKNLIKLGIDIAKQFKYNIMSVVDSQHTAYYIGSRREGNLCQKSELKKMNLWTALFADLSVSVQKQVFCQKYVRENTMKNLA